MSWFNRKTSHARQVEAIVTVFGNLYEKTTRGGADAPTVLKFSASDSRFRYLMFCVSAAFYSCAPVMKNAGIWLPGSHTI